MAISRVDAQRRFSLHVLEKWGMDRAAWRLDKTVHPFMTCFSPSDIRLTTNFHEDSLHGVLSCLHEFGHGVYERNVDPRFARTPLAEGVSSAFHESQSRLWENLVGRNLSTWRFFYPQLQDEFPDHFAHVSLETFHRALNKVEPTMRRVDADEVTYSLHIILRFELERAMLNGDLDLRDLPEAFSEKMREYMGLQPPDVTSGALQDAHWSDLTFGYFPTYALGNVVSVQLWERIESDLGSMDEHFERGEFGPLREWLTDNVYRWGRTFTPQELLTRAAGGPMDPEPYVRYLERKLKDLAGRRGRVIRKVLVVVGGFVLLAAGGLLMVLPGPGIPLVVAGLGLLSLEFEWARRLRLYVMRHVKRVAPESRNRQIALGVLSLAAMAGATVFFAMRGVPGF